VRHLRGDLVDVLHPGPATPWRHGRTIRTLRSRRVASPGRVARSATAATVLAGRPGARRARRPRPLAMRLPSGSRCVPSGGR
jgi:hypothetical protein